MLKDGESVRCNSCGFKGNGKLGSDNLIVAKSTEKETIMIRGEKTVEPIDSDAICPKCRKRGAYYVLKQMLPSDEPETKFNTCVSCGYKWRDY